MAVPEDYISAQLLSRLEGSSNKEKWENLSRDYPWYPLPWLMLAETEAAKQKAALWFKNEHRIHWLLNRNDSDAGIVIAPPATSTIDEDLSLEESVNAKGPNDFAQNETNEYGQQSTELAENEHAAVEPPVAEHSENEFVPDETEQEVLHIQLDEEEIKEELESPDAVVYEDRAVIEAGTIEDPTTATSSQKEQAENQSTVNEIRWGEKSEAGEKLLFEPLYTTDYFASQGIKVDPGAIPITKLDRQVKSFTQWLKTMKRVGPPETSAAADPLVDAHASASVREKDVITEAMVAVLEKQGKYQKAIDTLGKLILLHPEKSAFFAAQIENLKAKQ